MMFSASYQLAVNASNAAWAGHSLTGSDLSAALNKDQVFRSDRSLANLQARPATGAAQLMTLAMEEAGYDPGNPAQIGSAAAFNTYVADILKNALFTAELNDTIAPSYTGTWGSIVNQMAAQFVGIEAAELSTLEQSMLKLGNAASSDPSTWETTNLIAQSAINCSNGGVEVYVYQTFIKMISTVHKGGKHEPDTVTNQANMSLHRVKLSFDVTKWPSTAESVQQKTNASLQSWAANNS